MKQSFVITNDRASYVFKEDNISLSSGAKEAALNEKRVKPCVPISKPATLRRGTGPPLLLVNGLSA